MSEILSEAKMAAWLDTGSARHGTTDRDVMVSHEALRTALRAASTAAWDTYVAALDVDRTDSAQPR